MRTLLEIKEIIRRIYSKNEVFLQPVLKCILALITLSIINGKLGFMSRIDNIGVVLIASLICSFLPSGFLMVFAALFILLHFYALAMEVALVGLCVFLIMALLFFRFAPKDSLAVLFTPIAFFFHVPYVMPISMGLIGTPVSAVSVGCGVVVHYLVDYVSDNATAIGALDSSETTARLRMVIDALLENQRMVVVLVAFTITLIAVYMVRRMSMDRSWTIAIISGAMLDAIILLLGDLMYSTNLSVAGVLFGSVVAAGIAKVLQFFVFSVDYSRTEKVQFEDDEYYYYVKAVPKMTLAEPAKTVKHINSQMRSNRTVTTEHTGRSASGVRGDRLSGGRAVSDRRSVAGRTVTTGRTAADMEDYSTDEETWDDLD